MPILVPLPMRTLIGGASANEDVITILGVAVFDSLADAIEGDMVEDGDILANNNSLVDDNAGGMVEEEVVA